MALDALDQVQIGLGSAIEEAVRWAVPIIQRVLPEMDGHYLLDCLKEANTEAQSLKRALEEAGPGEAADIMAKRGKSREEKDFQAYKTEIKKRLNENSERGALMKGYRARHYWAVSLLDFGHVPLVTGDREHSDSVCAAARGLIEWFRGEQDEVALWISDGTLRAMIRATPEAAICFTPGAG